MKAQSISLDNVCEGKVADEFDDAIATIIGDVKSRPGILDKRSIEIKIELTPNENGYMTQSATIDTKLPKMKHAGVCKLSKAGKLVQLVEMTEPELDLQTQDEADGKVVKIDKTQKTGDQSG